MMSKMIRAVGRKLLLLKLISFQKQYYSYALFNIRLRFSIKRKQFVNEIRSPYTSW